LNELLASSHYPGGKAGLFGEYKDIRIEKNPTEDKLITTEKQNFNFFNFFWNLLAGRASQKSKKVTFY
jgi:hypothetical protein